MIDSDRGITTYQYDEIDRLVEIFDPYGEVTTYQYDEGGRRIAMQRPNGVITSYYYGAANRLLSLVNKKSLEDIISSYTYTKIIGGYNFKLHLHVRQSWKSVKHDRSQ
jgi:YD repeat-containing protein